MSHNVSMFEAAEEFIHPDGHSIPKITAELQYRIETFMSQHSQNSSTNDTSLFELSSDGSVRRAIRVFVLHGGDNTGAVAELLAEL